MSTKQIYLAMSGGVDSAAAALLLRRAGCDVSAVTLRLHRDTDRPGTAALEMTSPWLPPWRHPWEFPIRCMT